MVGRHQRDLLAQRLHRNAVADDDAARLELLLVFQVFAAQPLGLDGVLQDDQSPLDGQRLLQKIEGAQLGGPHRGLDVAVSGDHDDLRMVFDLDQLLQGFEAVDAGQPDVEQHNIHRLAAKRVQALLAASREQRFVALILQHALQRAADLGLVIHDQNGLHFAGQPPGPCPGPKATLR